jgi:DNA-directed RNA polymerase subunit RPC12/RpoP
MRTHYCSFKEFMKGRTNSMHVQGIKSAAAPRDHDCRYHCKHCTTGVNVSGNVKYNVTHTHV